MTNPTHRSMRARFRALFTALALTGALTLATTREAQAGTTQFRDPNALIDAPARDRVRLAAGPLPFDLRVLVETTPDAATLGQRAQQALTHDEQLVVALDPVHRRTSVRAGRGLRIAPERLARLADAGDPYFRIGDFAGGVNAIATYANSSLGSGRVRSAPSFPIGAVVIAGVVGLVLFALAMSRRRASGAYAPSPSGAGAYRAPSPPSPYGGPAYGTPSYGPGYGPGYGPYGAPGGGVGSAVGAGVAGAALGGLAGYAIGRSLDHDERDDHGAANHASSHDHEQGGGSDASSWDDGGGFDGGGGGFDGGGSDGGWD